MNFDSKTLVIPTGLCHPYSKQVLETLREDLQKGAQNGVAATVLQSHWRQKIQTLMDREEDEIMHKIPRLYRDNNPRLMPDPQAHTAVLQWQSHVEKEPDYKLGNPRGLICYGPTGCGKTRAIFDLMARMSLMQLDDFGFSAISATEFSALIRELAPCNPRRLARILRLLSGRERSDDLAREDDEDVKRFFGLSALFIDDLSQAKFTPRYAEELLSVIEARTADENAVFVTCQMTGDRLLHKLAGDNPDLRETAEAIIRRLRDFCDPIGFCLGNKDHLGNADAQAI